MSFRPKILRLLIASTFLFLIACISEVYWYDLIPKVGVSYLKYAEIRWNISALRASPLHKDWKMMLVLLKTLHQYIPYLLTFFLLLNRMTILGSEWLGNKINVCSCEPLECKGLNRCKLYVVVFFCVALAIATIFIFSGWRASHLEVIFFIDKRTQNYPNAEFLMCQRTESESSFHFYALLSQNSSSFPNCSSVDIQTLCPTRNHEKSYWKQRPISSRDQSATTWSLTHHSLEKINFNCALQWILLFNSPFPVINEHLMVNQCPLDVTSDTYTELCENIDQVWSLVATWSECLSAIIIPFFISMTCLLAIHIIISVVPAIK
jgi:hypothetical protein